MLNYIKLMVSRPCRIRPRASSDRKSLLSADT